MCIVGSKIMNYCNEIFYFDNGPVFGPHCLFDNLENKQTLKLNF